MATFKHVNIQSDKDENWNDPTQFSEVTEGKAKILLPKSNTVFYNNVQVFNRDLSIAVIKTFCSRFIQENSKNKLKRQDSKFSKEAENNVILINEKQTTVKDEFTEKQKQSCKINILEALSATGLRSVRYALEIPYVNEIIANDLSKDAVANIERNIQYNNMQDKIKSSHADASLLMYLNRFPLSKRFQIIDLDPYGSPSQFLDGAVQAIDDGGLLCITCTDMGGLCGNHGEAAFAKYGSMPLKAKYCHEMALRIVLSCVDTHAGRYKRYIEPIIAISADFYIRLFVRIYTGAQEVKRSASKKSYVFHCSGCETFTLQPVGKSTEVGNSKKYNPASGPKVGKECEECGFVYKIGGPIWSEPMHNQSFIKQLLEDVRNEKDNYATFDRINGVLTVVLEELEDVPLYYAIDHLCNIIHSITPSHSQFRSAILHAGYKVSSTHANEIGIKTDAPASVLWDILRSWVKLHPVNPNKIKERSPAKRILEKKNTIEGKFEVHLEAVPSSKKLKITRFPVNPEADWGPKSRAKQSSQYECLADKRKELQGKRTRAHGQYNHKQFSCKRFKRGECDLGDGCKYSHEPDTKYERVEENSDILTPNDDEPMKT